METEGSESMSTTEKTESEDDRTSEISTQICKKLPEYLLFFNEFREKLLKFTHKSQEELLDFLDAFQLKLEQDSKFLQRNHNRALNVARRIIYILVAVKDINRQFVFNASYYHRIAKILAVFMDLIIRHSTDGSVEPQVISKRIENVLENHLKHSLENDNRYVLEAFIHMNNLDIKYKEVLRELFERYLQRKKSQYEPIVQPFKMYIAYIILFSQWKQMEQAHNLKKNIKDLCLSLIRHPPDFFVHFKLKSETWSFPIIPETANPTEILLDKPKSTIKNLLKFLRTNGFNENSEDYGDVLIVDVDAEPVTYIIDDESLAVECSNNESLSDSKSSNPSTSKIKLKSLNLNSSMKVTDVSNKLQASTLTTKCLKADKNSSLLTAEDKISDSFIDLTEDEVDIDDLSDSTLGWLNNFAEQAERHSQMPPPSSRKYETCHPLDIIIIDDDEDQINAVHTVNSSNITTKEPNSALSLEQTELLLSKESSTSEQINNTSFNMNDNDNELNSTSKSFSKAVYNIEPNTKLIDNLSIKNVYLSPKIGNNIPSLEEDSKNISEKDSGSGSNIESRINKMNIVDTTKQKHPSCDIEFKKCTESKNQNTTEMQKLTYSPYLDNEMIIGTKQIHSEQIDAVITETTKNESIENSIKVPVVKTYQTLKSSKTIKAPTHQFRTKNSMSSIEFYDPTSICEPSSSTNSPVIFSMNPTLKPPFLYSPYEFENSETINSTSTPNIINKTNLNNTIATSNKTPSIFLETANNSQSITPTSSVQSKSIKNSTTTNIDLDNLIDEWSPVCEDEQVNSETLNIAENTNFLKSDDQSSGILMRISSSEPCKDLRILNNQNFRETDNIKRSSENCNTISTNMKSPIPTSSSATHDFNSWDDLIVAGSIDEKIIIDVFPRNTVTANTKNNESENITLNQENMFDIIHTSDVDHILENEPKSEDDIISTLSNMDNHDVENLLSLNDSNITNFDEHIQIKSAESLHVLRNKPLEDNEKTDRIENTNSYSVRNYIEDRQTTSFDSNYSTSSNYLPDCAQETTEKPEGGETFLPFKKRRKMSLYSEQHYRDEDSPASQKTTSPVLDDHEISALKDFVSDMIHKNSNKYINCSDYNNQINEDIMAGSVNQNKNLCYPGTPMLSIASLECYPYVAIAPRQFKTPAQLKEMTPINVQSYIIQPTQNTPIYSNNPNNVQTFNIIPPTQTVVSSTASGNNDILPTIQTFNYIPQPNANNNPEVINLTRDGGQNIHRFMEQQNIMNDIKLSYNINHPTNNDIYNVQQNAVQYPSYSNQQYFIQQTQPAHVHQQQSTNQNNINMSPYNEQALRRMLNLSNYQMNSQHISNFLHNSKKNLRAKQQLVPELLCPNANLHSQQASGENRLNSCEYNSINTNNKKRKEPRNEHEIRNPCNNSNCNGCAFVSPNQKNIKSTPSKKNSSGSTDRITRSSNRTSIVNYKDDTGTITDDKNKGRKRKNNLNTKNK